MDLTSTHLLKGDKVHKSEVEQVVKQKQEYTLLGKYNISRGFKLFCYNPTNSKITQPEIKRGDFIQCELVKSDEGIGWIWFDPENMNITINSRNIYFESLNMKTAIKRVMNWRAGKVTDLFNLSKPREGSIDIFNMF